GRLQELAPVAGHLTRGEGEDSACLLHRLAAQVPAYHACLARGGAHVASLGAHHLAPRARRSRGLGLARAGGGLRGLVGCRLLSLRGCRLLSLAGGGLLGLGGTGLPGSGLLLPCRLLGNRLLRCNRLLLGDGLLLRRLLGGRPLLRGRLGRAGGLALGGGLGRHGVGRLLGGGLLGSRLLCRGLLLGSRLVLRVGLCLRLLGSLLVGGLVAHRTFPEPAWPRNTRVGANSPSLWPTMDSLMNTGTCFLPSWTASVWPTMSGKIVDARDQVLIIFLVFSAFIASMRAIRRSSTQGPFLLERLIFACPSRVGDRARCTCLKPCSSCACGSRA